MTLSKLSKKIRCAIYTRKSSDEGLEQEFNSLDAQYDACTAYILSQKHEGWRLVNKRYDDGGISGATMERGGLKALMADIDAGLIDMIVVYKIDRLTRSLSDFAKIVDQLDAKSASFVSVTQSFNTSTSMGRLTLNMLLSFAQFEREVTAERIRDKIAASKAKGLWMGGPVPFGYDPHPDKTLRKLLVNQSEAVSIRTIFDLYLELGNLSQVSKACEVKGIRSKSRPTYTKRLQGNGVLTNGQIHHILTNPLYIGKIRHKDKVYDGQHEALIDQTVWDLVQTKLQSAAARKRGQAQQFATKEGANQQSSNLLTGKLFDETGDHLTPTHTKKNGVIKRYYISNRLIKAKDPTGWRLPAEKIEKAVAKAIQDLLQQPDFPIRILQNPTSDNIIALQKDIRGFATTNGFMRLIQRVDLGPTTIQVQLDKNTFATAMKLANDEINEDALNFTTPIQLKRRGVESKIIIGDTQTEPNALLQNLVAKANAWADQIKQGATVKDLATSQNITQSYIRERIPIAFLSPKIQSLILEGQQPVEWTIKTLIKQNIPLDWNEQHQKLLKV